MGTLLLPSFALAATTFKNIIFSTLDIIGNYLIPVLFALALAYFIWGVADFILSANNQAEREAGKTRIIWGIVALFAMVAYLGLVNIFSSGFFNTSSTLLPQLFTS